MAEDSLDLKARKALMSAHLYYDLDSPILWDTEFDALCLELADRWDELSRLRQIMLGDDPVALRATGSHFQISRQTMGGARSWHNDLIGWTPDKHPAFVGEAHPEAKVFLQKIGAS